jgi:4-carboxymuconolactone decarboxylase
MSNEKYTAGMTVRREVLSDEYVDKAIAATTEFTKPLQDMIVENCWGEVWTRGVLPKKTRSLITIAMLAALKMPAELKAHVLGGLRNGCTVDEIQEVLLQATVYCGVPSGVEAFRTAKEVIENWHGEQ